MKSASYQFAGAVFATAMLVVPVGAASLSFDFGGGAAGNVNNVVAEDQNFNNAVDTAGVVTIVDLTVTSETGWAVVPNTSGTAAPGAPASDFFASDQTDDNLFGFDVAFNNPIPLPLIDYAITGLMPGGLYDFTFFASRMGVSDVRDAQYDVSGVNSMSVVLDAANNTDNIVQALGIEADANGDLSLSIQSGPNNNNSFGFFYLGAMQIDGDFTAVPEPGSMILLAIGSLGLLLATRRR